MKKIFVYIETPGERDSHKLHKREVKSIEEGRDLYISHLKSNAWGGSDLQFIEGGFITLGTWSLVDYKKEDVIARISYNGKVWDPTGKGIRDYLSHPEILPENFNDYLKEKNV